METAALDRGSLADRRCDQAPPPGRLSDPREKRQTAARDLSSCRVDSCLVGARALDKRALRDGSRAGPAERNERGLKRQLHAGVRWKVEGSPYGLTGACASRETAPPVGHSRFSLKINSSLLLL